MTDNAACKGRKTIIDIQIGARLKNQRCLTGLSQAQLGKLSGLTFQQIQKYEMGSNRMAASRVYQLADLLGVPVTYFYEGLKDRIDRQNVQHTENDMRLHKRESMNLLNVYYKITDVKKRRKIYELIRSIVKAA